MRSSRLLSWVSAFVVGVVGVVGLGSVGARAERLAVLQIEAPGLLAGAREELEDQVRLGLKDAGVDVQDGARTAGFVREAAAAGLACSLADPECALRVAVAADVDGVVVGRLVALGGKSALELSLVSLDGARQSVAGSEAPRLCARRLKDPSASAATALPQPLIVEPEDAGVVIDGAGVVLDDGVVWLAPGPHKVTLGKSGYESRTVVIDVPGDRLPRPTSLVLDREFPLLTGVGLVVASGGVVVAAAGGLFVAVVEADFADGIRRADVEGGRAAGQLMIGVTSVGLVAVAAGTAMALAGGLE